MGFDPISSIIDLVKTGVDKIFPDAGEKEKNALTAWMTEFQGRLSSLMAELNGNWMQRSWRPILMLVIIAIIANNYILHPYVELFFPGKSTTLELDQNMWDLLKIGVGGYTLGRSAEKIAQRWNK